MKCLDPKTAVLRTGTNFAKCSTALTVCFKRSAVTDQFCFAKWFLEYTVCESLSVFFSNK